MNAMNAGADQSDPRGRPHTNNPQNQLSVNKSSKIGKGIRRPAPQPLTIYKTGPEGFRNLVQELTGAGSSSSSAENRAHPAIAASSTRTPNLRLQKIAPPPLLPPQPMRPGFSYGLNNSQAEVSASPSTAIAPVPLSPLLSPANPNPISQQRVSTAPSFPFSNLGGDNMWTNGLESPASANMRQLAQFVATGEVSGSVLSSRPESPLPLSPAFSTGFGFSSIMQAHVSAASADAQDFSFPGPDFLPGY